MSREGMPGTLLDELRRVVGRESVLDEFVDLQTYEYDACAERSLPSAVVFVNSTAETSAVVKILHRERVPFVPRGYGTNVSGGSLALDGAVVLEMGHMNKVLEIDIPNLCVVVQPGVFTWDVSVALSPFGYYYAPDPASMKASSVGGNIAENAGGPHCFKYGVTTNHVLGLELVLPDGEITWLGGKEVDPLGLDLAGVFVGCEGTLGIVTAAVLRILRKPETVQTMLGVFPSSEAAGNAVSAIVAAGLTPATLEMMDSRTIRAVEDALACGYPRDAGAVLLIELDGLCDGMNDMAGQIAALCRANGALEVRVAQDEAERAALWRGRQGTFAAITRLAPSHMSMDGTVPRTMLPEALRRVGELGRDYGLEVFCVLHAGDGNLHPCFLYDAGNQEDKKKVEGASMEVLKICVELGGTVSGEHGIGIEKLKAMEFVFDDNDLRAQRFVKQAFDPRGLCNPGKVLPAMTPAADAGRVGDCATDPRPRAGFVTARSGGGSDSRGAGS
ncbi:MAG: FAD-linked oxidase C-terminal domain-containing protein [bacterium]